MKKILMYIGGVLSVVVAMPVIFVFAIRGAIVYAKDVVDWVC